MAVGKNKKLGKGKGLKKRAVDPFTRKDWYDIKAPTFFENRNVGKTLVNRSQGLSAYPPRPHRLLTSRLVHMLTPHTLRVYRERERCA